MVYMIFVERTGQSSQYADFDKNLRALGNWAELGQGGLLLEADRMTAAQIRDLLRPHLPEGDKMFVARISKNWAGLRMPASFPDWMSRRNFDAKGTLPHPRSASRAGPCAPCAAGSDRARAGLPGRSGLSQAVSPTMCRWPGANSAKETGSAANM